jgi:hypothetical protein
VQGLAQAIVDKDLNDEKLKYLQEQAKLEQIRAEQQKFLDDSQRKSFDTNDFSSPTARLNALGKEGAEKEKTAFINQYEALFKDKRLDKVTAQFAERQFLLIRNIFDPKKAQEIEAQFIKFWDKYAKVALGALKNARDGAEKFYSSITERGEGRSNPFVKVILEADEASRNLQKTFGVLGDSAVKDLRKIEESFTRQRLLALELDAQLKANSLRREATNLANPTGLSGREERLLNQLDIRINAATNAPGLLAVADALGRGAVGSRAIGGEELLQRRYASGLG